MLCSGCILCQLQTQFWAVREYLAPVLKDSKFKEHGRCVLPLRVVALVQPSPADWYHR